MRLQGKVALITGGGAGIGRACVDLFANEGAHVVLAERDAETGEAARDAVLSKGQSCLFVPTDVSQPDDVRRAVDLAVATYGRVDILYNNVGGSTLNDGPVTTAPFEEFWNKMKVDLFGTWLGCHYAIPHMISAGGGSVINATSVTGLMGLPSQDAYTAAKGAIAAITRSMAVEFAPHNIRVNAIAPGSTVTERTRKRREQEEINGAKKRVLRSLLGVIDPIEIAYAVLYLASDESRKTTGHIMVVDSGMTIS